MQKPQSPSNDVLLIDVRLLLDYDQVSRKTYESVGVPSKSVKTEPFYSWMPTAMKTDLEDAAMYQVARDGRLTDQLFDPKAKIRELGALEITHLFLEAGAKVHVFSHETPEALDIVIARAGLPASVQRWPMIDPFRVDELVTEILDKETSNEWMAAYTLGLTPKTEQHIITRLGRRGVFINLTGKRSSTTSEDRLLQIVSERWSYM